MIFSENRLPLFGIMRLRIKMVERSAAVPDLQGVGSGNRGGDVGFGVLRRGDEVAALGEAGGDRRRQRAAGAVGILGGDALGRQPDDLTLADQQIDAFIAFSKMAGMTA